MLAEIGEGEATGETAAIYAQVRELWGVPYVSAIQRHLATRPGVLEWAWEAVEPVFRSGIAQVAAAEAADGVAVAPLAPISADALALWGVDDQATRSVRAIAEGFVRVAPINMMFAAVLKALMAGAMPGGRPRADTMPWTPPPPLPSPPSMVAVDTLSPAARGVMLAFATMSDGKPFVPGLYRMLAHWPALLAHLATVLPPRLAEPSITAAFDQIRARIDAAVPDVVAALPQRPWSHPMPSDAERQHFLTIGGTYRKTSPELIVLGRLIADAMPR